MKLYTFKAIQKFPVRADAIWNFISNPGNLSVITPPAMRCKTLSGGERNIHPGQIIHHTITPILGIKLQWITEITHVDPKKFFVDEQRYGPYAFWHHKHFVKETEGGCEMEDVVHYKLPMGILGQLAHPFLVKQQLEAVFEFRKKKLHELFGQPKNDSK